MKAVKTIPNPDRDQRQSCHNMPRVNRPIWRKGLCSRLWHLRMCDRGYSLRVFAYFPPLMQDGGRVTTLHWRSVNQAFLQNLAHLSFDLTFQVAPSGYIHADLSCILYLSPLTRPPSIFHVYFHPNPRVFRPATILLMILLIPSFVRGSPGYQHRLPSLPLPILPRTPLKSWLMVGRNSSAAYRQVWIE